MRAFLDVLRFELRFQCRTPLFAGVLLVFFLIHLLTMAQAGIHLGDNELVRVNSTYQIVQVELVLSIFGMLPALMFIVNAVVRDFDRGTIELFFTTPVDKRSWLLGRFAGGTLCALFAGLSGLLGSMAGTVMPWLEPARVAPFELTPYLLAFAALDVPNLLAFCAICFGVAALGRSQAWAFGLALGLVVIELVLHNATTAGAPAWLPLLDPFGGLAVVETSRFWTVADLNTRLPFSEALLVNRAVWLALGGAALAFTLGRFQVDVSHLARPSRGLTRVAPAADPAPAAVPVRVAGRFAASDVLRQFLSQVRIDLRAVVLSPLFALVAVFTVGSTVSEFQANTAAILELPLHPLTSLMVGFFRYGLLQFVLLILIVYSATLVFREQDRGMAEIVGASPTPDWLMPLSKTLTLCAALSLVLLTSMATSVALQLLAGHTSLDLDVYAKGLFVYNGFYFGMLCVLAVVVQVVSPGRWSGMLLLFALLAALFSLEPLGFEHVLYGFRIPYVVYSDMNGYDPYRTSTLSLIVYWGWFCGLLLVAAHALYPRGTTSGLGPRLHEARRRMTPALVRVTAVLLVLFAASGGWIYWNTNILNAYDTADSRLLARAAYERVFGTWKNRPTPAFADLTMEVELYPEERRLESRGRATLVNRKEASIDEFIVSTDPRLRFNTLTIEHARLMHEDRVLGVRQFRLDPPLLPGGTLSMEWNATRRARGFVNAQPDTDIVANGTFIEFSHLAPFPSYDEEREVTEPAERRRVGLPPVARLPALGDPAWLNTLGFGIDGRTTFRVRVGTSVDQTAVAPGALEREWVEGGRRYFEYVMGVPVWPQLLLTSARYQVARDSWNGVSLEVYHDAKHAWNVGTMLETAKQGLAYFTREFAPYPLPIFRILEYPRYSGAARAFAGAVAYSESAGFLTDLSHWAPRDYATIHELAHQWWGGLAYGAKMQGRQMLNETMAQYSTLMIFRQQADQQWLRRILTATHRNYLAARRREDVGEQPLMFTEDQGNISYNKGALAMFALQELIGTERMHEGLRNFLRRFGLQPPPYPTSRDLVAELRAVAGPDYQRVITDLFERIVLYDIAVTTAAARPVDGQYEVTLDVAARQFEADGHGAEREEPLDTWFDVVVFPVSASERVTQTPLYQAKHRLRTGTQQLVVRVPAAPGAVGVDPYHVMIDRVPENNVYELPADR